MNENVEKLKKDNDIMVIIAKTIIKSRYIILAIFIILAIYCVTSINKVKVNEDITSFLPETTETRQGISIMNDEFTTYATANVMVSNIVYEEADKLARELADYTHVSDVEFDDSTVHYKNSSALFVISFDGLASDQTVIDEFNGIKERLSKYDVYISSTIGKNYSAEVAEQMVGVIAIVGVIIAVVLLFTSRSYFEVVIFVIVFAFAAVLNMGTNHFLGEISSITKSIAVVLQLALAIDYSIIFCHRYQDEVIKCATEREALIKSLAASIIEIASSSLTTISGLIAIAFMQFGLGFDLGVVLTKGIVCSLLTVFLFMPGLISFFPRQLKNTAHKSFVPDITIWGKFLTNSKYCFVIVFVLVIPLAVYCSGKTQYVFSQTSVDQLIQTEKRMSEDKISSSFDRSTPIAVIVPSGNYEKEKAVLQNVSQLDGIKKATGLANTEIEKGRAVTDKYTPRMFSELLNIDIEQATLIYQLYGLEKEDYKAVFDANKDYSVPLIDLVEFCFKKIDQGIITLDSEKQEKIDTLKKELKRGTDQLRGKNYSRFVLTATVPVEDEKSFMLVEEIRAIAEKEYGTGNVIIAGDITSARDLKESYESDSTLINIITIVFVFLIVLFTFRTLFGAIILVLVIQTSIWINFSFLYLQDMNTSFVTYMIVSAIQMGATIDYAIVIMNRFLTYRKTLSPKEALPLAINESFSTVLTSGSILTLAGFIISWRVDDVYIGHIGLAVGRGALVSIILVLTVLPQLLLLCDKLIQKTKFTINFNIRGDKD